MTCKVKILLCLLLVCLVPFAMATPTIGAAGSITSNNATFTIAGSSGSTVVSYGLYPGSHTWYSDNYTSPSSITIWGAPIMGGQKYYASACDDTGCGNEVTWTMAAITPIPTRGFDAGWNGLVMSHWSLATISMFFLYAYTTNIPLTIFWGFIVGAIVIGFWRKTKHVRLIGILMIVLSPILMTPSTGLYIGMPLAMQSLGAVLFALGFAGVALSLIKK